MNRYFLLHRLTGPAILVLLGIVALLHQAGLVRFDIFVPLLLILIGVIKLAQRAIMMQEPFPQAGPYPGSPYAGQPYPGATTYPQQPYPGAPYQAPAAPGQAVQGAVVPPASAHPHDFGNDPEGGSQ